MAANIAISAMVLILNVDFIMPPKIKIHFAKLVDVLKHIPTLALPRSGLRVVIANLSAQMSSPVQNRTLSF